MQAVVWHDGAAWRAALDTSDLHPEPGPGGAPRAGALAAAAPMTNFRAERQYGTFSAEDACNYALNIYDAGAVLSIVVDADPHGTHVAGIAAACHPDAPELNGAAPGAAAPCRACTGHVRAASRVREGCEQGWRQLPDMRTPRCHCCGDVASCLLSGEAGGCESAVAGSAVPINMPGMRPAWRARWAQAHRSSRARLATRAWAAWRPARGSRAL